MFPDAIRDNAYPILVVYDDGNRRNGEPNRNTFFYGLSSSRGRIRPLKPRNLRFRVNAIWPIWHHGGFLNRLLLMEVTHRGRTRACGLDIYVSLTYHSLRIPKRIAELTYLTFVKPGSCRYDRSLRSTNKIRPRE